MSSSPRPVPGLILIAAVADNGVIGRDNALPWRLKADLQRFRQLTLGHAVLMGRNTWASLGRPLPQRRNLVVTRQTELPCDGAEVFGDIDTALASCDGGTCFVIGGAQIYAQLIDRASRLEITQVRAEIEGDTCFPPIDADRFVETGRSHHDADRDNEYPVDFVSYLRR